MDKKTYALSLFDNDFNCCQAVFAAFSEDLNLDTKTALKISCSFGGGMRKGNTCGAVTGALMVIGLKYGHYNKCDIESKQNTYSLASEFQDRFIALNKSVICKKLLGHDLSTVSGMEILKEKGLFKTLCPKYIKDSIDILEEMLLN